MNENIIARTTLIISNGLFLFSLTQECYCTTSGCGGSWSGLAVLISGCLGFFMCPAAYTWLANPLLLASWININKKGNASLIGSSIATLLTISFLFFHQVIVNEGGNYDNITGYKLGYWLWMASSLTTLIGSVIIYQFRKKQLQAQY